MIFAIMALGVAVWCVHQDATGAPQPKSTWLLWAYLIAAHGDIIYLRFRLNRLRDQVEGDA